MRDAVLREPLQRAAKVPEPQDVLTVIASERGDSLF